MTRELAIALIGATGLVGREMLNLLDESSLPISKLHLLASEESAGERVDFRNQSLVVQPLSSEFFNSTRLNIALFAAGKEVSLAYCPLARRAGAIVIDNSSAFRLEEDIPLVVPEVNPQDILPGPGIIANPNCSTIQMLVALKPLHDEASIKRIVVSTYQSVSGVGKAALDELLNQISAILNMTSIPIKVFQHQIAFNLIPHIDFFHSDGYTNEEKKIELESKKILKLPSLKISATAVRVPTFVGHGESINVEFNHPISETRAREVLTDTTGVVVLDNPANNLYPMPQNCSGKDQVYVGRIRRDRTVPHGLNLWVVADNVRKGAALNAVQIAELWFKKSINN